MKDIYELLNDIDVDEAEIKEIEEMDLEITELEKMRVKKHLRKVINKNKVWHHKGVVAAAVIGLIIGGPLYVGIAAPAYAAELPVVGDIFRFLDNGRTGIYDLYKENAQEINVTKESNGISMTIKDAIFDGKTIFYTYELKTDKDLGEHPMVGEGSGLYIQGYRGGLSGSSRVEKVGEGTYIGQNSYSIDGKRDELNFKLNLKGIIVAEPEREEKIKGSWKFEFKLKAVDGIQQTINKSIEKEGFAVTLNTINKTPMSFIIDFTQQVPESYRTEWDGVTTDLEVKDDLGNVYKGNCNGGSGNVNTGIANFSETFGKLNEKATKLIITPKIFCSTMAGGVAMDEAGNGTEIKPTEIKEDKELFLPSITVNLQ